MTFIEFCDTVRGLGRQWTFDSNGSLRTDDTCRDCPIMAVYRKYYGCAPHDHVGSREYEIVWVPGGLRQVASRDYEVAWVPGGVYQIYQVEKAPRVPDPPGGEINLAGRRGLGGESCLPSLDPHPPDRSIIKKGEEAPKAGGGEMAMSQGMLLSDAIRIGCRRYPRQARLVFFSTDGTGACAIGAMAAGLGYRPSKRFGSVDTWEWVITRRPELGDPMPSAVAEAMKTIEPEAVADLTLFEAIILLNDTGRWSRERIADLLECGGCDG